MHFRRFTCLLLGAWLGGILLIAMVATQSFRTVDSVLLDPQPAATQELKAMGHEFARMLLRWEAGEQNRRLFEMWETVQLGLGVAVFFVLLFGSTESKYSLGLSLLMLLVVMLQRFLLTPMMTATGRLIDFVPQGVHSTDRIRFQVLHMGYGGLEAGKCLFGMLLGAKLLLRSRNRSSQAGGDVDLIDKTYHRHINR